MNKLVTAAIGLVIGGLAGYLMRPAAPLVGQVPFSAVISRGPSLEGLDQVLVPLAQESFNYLPTGALAGAVLGLLLGPFLLTKKRGAP